MGKQSAAIIHCNWHIVANALHHLPIQTFISLHQIQQYNHLVHSAQTYGASQQDY